MTNTGMRNVDDDDISVTSTAPGEQESEYEVETILSERVFDDQLMYLVKWAGYPIERSTWESAESFFNDETFVDWSKKKKAIAEGNHPEFDLVSFENHLIALENAREQRKRRREAKRRRLGLSGVQTDASKKQRVEAGKAAGSSAHLNPPPSVNTSGPETSDPGIARMNPSPSRPTAVRHVPPKPSMVLFGSGQNRQGPWMATRNKNRKPNEQDKPFSNLSTKWRFEKAKGYEPPPNISQLKLIRPSDWPARTGAPVFPPKTKEHTVNSPKGDAPVSSPVDRSNSVSGSDRFHPSSPTRRGSDLHRQGHTSDSRRPEYSSPKAPRLPQRQASRDSWKPESPLIRRPPLPERQASGDSWRPGTSDARDAFSPERPAPDSCRPDSSYSRGPSWQSGDSRKPPNDRHSPPSNAGRLGNHDVQHLSRLRLETDGASSSKRPNEEPLPPLPPRRPITFKGANLRRARDDNFQSRYWNPGEVFVNMYFGSERRSIGPVRLCGMSSLSRTKVLQTKKDNRIEIWFQEICTLYEYRHLCDISKSNYRYDNGWIEGYDDTEPDVYRSGLELQRGNFLAICYPEEPSHNKNVLLAYSPSSPDFDFLRDGYNFSPETFLHLTVRNQLARIDRPKVTRPMPARITALQDDSFGISRAGTEELPTPTDQKVERDLLDAQIAQELQRQLSDASDASKAREEFSKGTENNVATPVVSQQQPTKSNEPVSVQEKAQQLSVGNFDVDDYFRDVFKMTFDMLATNNGVEKGRAQVFYLMCPPDNASAQDECGIMIEFLKKHKAVIFSSRLEEDWERFVRTINRGGVLFHDSFANYDSMSNLRDLIHKPFTFWSFSLTGVGEGNNKTYFQRLFPHGGVILLTEDFMLHEPDATVIFLAWFNDWTRKKFPGSWKIMLRPNVLEWLLQQPEPREKARQGVWLAMYSLIAQLSATDNGTHLIPNAPLDGIHDDSPENRIISPPHIPSYGHRTESDCPNLPKNLTQEQRDTDHLAEFFAGWALINSHRFRRFVIVTTKPCERWSAWNHVDVKETAMDFFKAYQVDYRSYWSKLRGKPTKEKEKETDKEGKTSGSAGDSSPSAVSGSSMSKTGSVSGAVQGPARL